MNGPEAIEIEAQAARDPELKAKHDGMVTFLEDAIRRIDLE
tara:strand:- start:520 stop:642 length:123 start_codon:yes stop_codon:yes gene_type:complete